MALAEDYTFQYKDDGVLLNTDATPLLPFVDITAVAGLDNAEFRVTERVREGQDGGFIDAEFENMRTIVLDGIVYGTANNIQAYLDSLKANYGPQKVVQPFYMKPAGLQERVLFAKSLGARYPWETSLRTGRVPIQFTLRAEDPTLYGPSVTTTTGMAIEATGRPYDKDYDYGYGGTTGSEGTVVFDNTGNKDVPAIIRVTNASDFTIVHDNTGNRLFFSIILLDGDYLDIDLRNKTVMLNGSANRRGTLKGTSRWFMLAPGINNLRFLGQPSGVGTPTMTVTARPGYR